MGKRRSTGRACLVGVIKGLKGFSTMEAAPGLFPALKCLKASSRHTCQGPCPELAETARGAEGRDWAASSARPGMDLLG